MNPFETGDSIWRILERRIEDGRDPGDWIRMMVAVSGTRAVFVYGDGADIVFANTANRVWPSVGLGVGRLVVVAIVQEWFRPIHAVPQ